MGQHSITRTLYSSRKGATAPPVHVRPFHQEDTNLAEKRQFPFVFTRSQSISGSTSELVTLPCGLESMAKSSAASADSGLGWAKKMRRVVIAGGSLKGAQYGDVQESEIAKAAKSYKGDPRFLQYCRLYMSSKILEPAEDNEEKLKQEESAAAKLWTWAPAIHAAFQKCLTKSRRWRFLACCLVLMVLMSRPAFSVLFSKVTILTIKAVIRRSVNLVTMILDAVLEEAVSQIDLALLPSPVERTTGLHSPDSQDVQFTLLSTYDTLRLFGPWNSNGPKIRPSANPLTATLDALG